MARLYSSGFGSHDIQAVTYGVMSDSTRRGMLERTQDLLRTTTGRMREWVEKSYNEISNLDLAGMRDRISSIRNRNEMTFEKDRVTPMRSLVDFHSAKSHNRRAIMASPKLYSLYREGVIAGYHGQFDDAYGGRVGRDNELYRQIYNGAYVEDGEDSGFVQYLGEDDVDTGYNEYSRNEIIDIRDNIAQAEAYVEAGTYDPTNQLGGTL